jgi:hypothetical protein
MKTTPIFENFKLLKKNMECNDWMIESFIFNYKNINYIVLAKLYLKDEKKPNYALLKIEFIKVNDFNSNLITPVNSNGFIIEIKKLRQFFGIDYSENLGDILKQFNHYFAKFIPTQINLEKSNFLEKFIITSLSKSDSESPDKIYCFTVKRNPNKTYRTKYNNQKTKMLRPYLYSKFKEDPTISFCYTNKKNEEKTDEEILLLFGKRAY